MHVESRTSFHHQYAAKPKTRNRNQSEAAGWRAKPEGVVICECGVSRILSSRLQSLANLTSKDFFY